METIIKTCSTCGVRGPHNERGGKEKGQFRCCYCGSPVGHSVGTWKKDYAISMMAIQIKLAARARA